jgi:hypothetical protein
MGVKRCQMDIKGCQMGVRWVSEGVRWISEECQMNDCRVSVMQCVQSVRRTQNDPEYPATVLQGQEG